MVRLEKGGGGGVGCKLKQSKNYFMILKSGVERKRPEHRTGESSTAESIDLRRHHTHTNKCVHFLSRCPSLNQGERERGPEQHLFGE